MAERRRARGVPTFAEATARVLEQKQAGWRSEKHRRGWMLSFERYAFPRIGDMAVSEVTTGDVLEILAPIWHTKAATAQYVRQRIRMVFEWAVAMEFRPDNPCDRVASVLGSQHRVIQHMKALPHREVGSAIGAVGGSGKPTAGALAFEFLVLTAARWGEVRWAEWSEIDRRRGVWTVPGTRMKAKREHRVPLCSRAAAERCPAATDRIRPPRFLDGPASRELGGTRRCRQARRRAPRADPDPVVPGKTALTAILAFGGRLRGIRRRRIACSARTRPPEG